MLKTELFKNDVDLNSEAQSLLPPGRMGRLFEEEKLLVTAATTNYIKIWRIGRHQKPAQKSKKLQHADSFNDNQSISCFLDLKIYGNP